MESQTVKQEIHQLINDIDDIEFLKAVQTIISAKVQENSSEDCELTDDEILMVEERREEYLRGEGKNYTWDEVKAFAKSQNKNV
jgi:phosphoribosylanthranilate isomerase